MSLLLEVASTASTVPPVEFGVVGIYRLRLKLCELSGGPLAAIFKSISEAYGYPISQRKEEMDRLDKKLHAIEIEGVEPPGLIHFCIASDIIGSISSSDCGDLLRIIGNNRSSLCFGPRSRQHHGTLGWFKKLLEECVRLNCDLKWS